MLGEEGEKNGVGFKERRKEERKIWEKGSRGEKDE